MPNIAKSYVNYLKILDVNIGFTKKIQKGIIMTVFYCILMKGTLFWGIFIKKVTEIQKYLVKSSYSTQKLQF